MPALPTRALGSVAEVAKTSSSHSSDLGPIVLAAGIVLLLVLSLRGRRRQRALRAEQTEIELGTTIVTRAGLIATLVDRTEDYVVLQLEDGTRARYVPQAVAERWHERVPDETDGVEGRDGADGVELPGGDDPPAAR